MNHTNAQRIAATVACIALVVAATSCGDDDANTTATTPSAPPTTIERVVTTSPPTTAPEPAAEADPSAATVVDDSWMDEAAAMCAAVGSELASAPHEITAFVAFFRGLRDRVPWFETLDLPDELRAAPTDVPSVIRQADEHLATAEAAIAAGDHATAELAAQQYLSLLEQSAALVTIAGAQCGDPTRAASASLNVPIPTAAQVTAGLGSVWVSQGPHFTTVTRVDPDSGDVLATIDLGVVPSKIQPADGRMIVRTADSYMAIDPTTNTIVDTLAKSDVGPAANRSWAVDGAMWICDGQQLHRYDPATFAPTGTAIELGIDCGQVYATDDLVVAWTYNEDEGESGASVAVFVDPATNQLFGTTPLPADVGVPIVLDDTVFFPAQGGNVNPVVDRATWNVAATPGYGRHIGASQMAHDGRSIYLIADSTDVLVVDADDYEMTDTFEPLAIVSRVNALATTPGALWVATDATGILQRFDIP